MVAKTTERSRKYPEAKVKQIEELVDLIDEYEVIALAQLKGISSRVIQGIRSSLRGKTELKVSKNTLKKIAIDRADKPEIEKLKNHIEGSVALVFSNDNPFKLQRFLLDNTVPAEAKPGQIAPKDVVVPASPTDLNPGPVIGELNTVGIRTKVEKGKIVITSDSTIISEGEEVTEDQAAVLNRLGIKPFSVGLTLEIAFEDGDIIEGKNLIVDEDEILSQLVAAHQHALGVAFDAVYVTEGTVDMLIQKAHQQAVNVGVEVVYPTKSTINILLSKARSQAKTLDAKVKF